MIKHCFLFCITDNNNNQSYFHMFDSNIRMSYEKRRNFGTERNPMDLELMRFNANWSNLKSLSDSMTSTLNDLYLAFSNALNNKPCTVTINYYAVPVLIDPRIGEIAEHQLSQEQAFVPEYFVKTLVSDAKVGTISYEITPIDDIISESTTIQLNKIEISEENKTIQESIILEKGEL